MEKTLLKKSLICGMVVLFFGMSILPIAGSLPIEKKPSVAMNYYSDVDCYPVFNGTMGLNCWYVSPVNVSFMYDPEIVKTIFYRINDGQWLQYITPFTIDEQGLLSFKWYYINYSGESSEVFVTQIKIDYTPPEISVTKERIGVFIWKITVEAHDNISGLHKAEFYYNGALQATFFIPPFEWTCIVKWKQSLAIMVKVYDTAGNFADAFFTASLSQVQSNNQPSFQQYSQINLQSRLISQQMNQLLQNLVLRHQTTN
jgi:hypothetical protein